MSQPGHCPACGSEKQPASFCRSCGFSKTPGDELELLGWWNPSTFGFALKRAVDEDGNEYPTPEQGWVPVHARAADVETAAKVPS